MKVISIMNRKGGASKTTTAQALGQGLELKGFKVLYVDLDAQCNLTSVLGQDDEDNEKNIFNVLQGENINKQIVNNVLCGTDLLSTADLALTGEGKEYRLKNALDKLDNQYDYVVIDTPPGLNTLTINAMVASAKVIIASSPDILAIKGIMKLNNTLEIVKETSNANLTINGILLTRFSLRTVLNRNLLKAFGNLAKQINTKVYDTKIRESVAIREAQTQGENLYEYAPKNGAIKDYMNFVEEFLKGEK